MSSHSLTNHWQKFIERMIDSGRYNNRSEVIRAGLRALEDAEETGALREFEKVFNDGIPGEPEEKTIQRVVKSQKSHRKVR